MQVEDLIQSTLEELAGTGFSKSSIEAALNTTEFSLRENNTGRFPRGLSLMLRAMGNWIYDKDPYEPLQWTAALDHFKVLPLIFFTSCMVLMAPLVRTETDLDQFHYIP